jgi:hypothetical protein
MKGDRNRRVNFLPGKPGEHSSQDSRKSAEEVIEWFGVSDL